MSLLRAHWRAPALLAVVALAVTAPTLGQLPSAAAAPGDVAFASSFEAEPVTTHVGEHAGGGPRARASPARRRSASRATSRRPTPA